MPAPIRFTISVDFSDEEAAEVGGRSTVRTAALDAVFDALQKTTDDICDNLALIQRDDGLLGDGVVASHTLDAPTLEYLKAPNGELRGQWLTAVDYKLKDIVVNATLPYICVVGHTSSDDFAKDLDAGLWGFLPQSANKAAGRVALVPIAGIAATNVQAALSELGAISLEQMRSLQDLANVGAARRNIAIKQGWPIALSNEDEQITTGTKVTIHAPFDFELDNVRASLTTAGTSPTTVDMNRNGVSVFGNRLVIDAGALTTVGAAVAKTILTKTFTKDDEITFDVDAAGAGATGLKVCMVIGPVVAAPTTPPSPPPPDPPQEPPPDPLPGTIDPPGTPQLPTIDAVPVPTFHNVGLYWTPPSNPGAAGVTIEYRRRGDVAWQLAYPMWYDARNNEARGSIVGLTPDTIYTVRFSMPGQAPLGQIEFTTWPEVFPEADVTTVEVGGQLDITSTMGGSAATGYRVYDGTAALNTRTGLTTATGSVVTGNNSTSGVIMVRASYVILRRIKTLQGGYSAIYIAPDVTNVVIEDCDISDFAWEPRVINGGTWAQHRSSGVLLAGNNSRIVIQRNKIHHPKRGTWTWEIAHPEGALGIFIRESGQQNVIRYNELYADIAGTGVPTEANPWWHDGIGGSENFSTRGSPGADSDIYGNIIRNCLDDGIEAEGGGRNVRIYGNYLDHVFSPIATTTANFGPMYIFRNVINRVRRNYAEDPDVFPRAAAFKNYGSVNGFGGGRKHYFHNTLLQMPGSEHSPAQEFPLGARSGNDGDNDNGQIETRSRNNIYHVWKTGLNAAKSVNLGWGNASGIPATANNHFANDLCNGPLLTDNNVALPASMRQDIISGVPTYRAGHGWSSIPALGGSGLGNYQLAAGSLGLGVGLYLPNFSVSTTPDIGAHQSGTPAMRFGITP